MEQADASRREGSAAGHTPGPWQAVRNECYWQIDSGPHAQIGDVCASKYIFINGVQMPEAEAEPIAAANARLIAAAPELLSLAQSLPVMLALAAKLHPDSPINWGQFEQDANDAVAKATQPSAPVGEANTTSESGA